MLSIRIRPRKVVSLKLIRCTDRLHVFPRFWCGQKRILVQQRMNLLRVYLNDMNTEEAMSELLRRMRGTKSNEEFLASMNG